MWSQPSVGKVWDWLLLGLLSPIVLLLGVGLPADWAQHNGKALKGSATVTSTETTRGGEVAVVEVRRISGEVVASDQEVNGEAPHRVGATFPVDYLAPDGAGDTQVYVAGHDPFATNLLVFALVLVSWMTSLAFAGGRMAGMTRAWRRGRPGRPQRYSAGRGYIDD